MNITGFKIILAKRLKEKWGRFILASGGIAVGIWAISLTTALSLGLSGTIISALNSQPSAREFQLFKTESGATGFLDVEDSSKFVPISVKETQELITNDTRIESILPSASLETAINFNANKVSCLDIDEGDNLDGSEKCLDVYYEPSTFKNFYEKNKKQWVGKTQNLAKDEIVVCYKCGDGNLFNQIGVKSPQEMIGKNITLEMFTSPTIYKDSKAIDFSKNSNAPAPSKLEYKNLKIVAVLDDRNSNSFSGGLTTMYMDYSIYQDKIANDNNMEFNNIFFLEYVGIVKDINNVKDATKDLTDKGYLVFAPMVSLVEGITIGFKVIAWVLAGFGLIALIASIFGIINVMVASVLERRKEIGILKSLGAKNRDIFNLFLIESAVLGVFGWFIGIILAYLMGLGIAGIANWMINGNDNWKDALDLIGVEKLSLDFPLWLWISTLALAVFFTTLSGVGPARRASKQNPVDVLRGE